ncbi:MAG: four helix bundle protein [Chloroflexota bacterium]
MAKGDDLEELLIDFAVQVTRVCGSLPQTAAGQHVGNQSSRCGTSPAANYGEARAAVSKRDFAHKLRIASKELDKSRIWLKIIVQTELLPSERLAELIDKSEQLCRIVGASIQTAQRELSNQQFAVHH